MTLFWRARWPIFFADNHLLVVFKPAGLLAQGDASGAPNLLDLCRAWVARRYAKPGRAFLGLVHRLDRPVAGVMVFARTSKAAARLSEQIRRRELRKRYLAVVAGRMPAQAAELADFHERRGRAAGLAAAASPHSREARLAYRVLAEAAGLSLVEIDLETGRKHQIRLQLARAGCPVLGDTRYGAAAPLPARRIALFARQLAFRHPTTGEPLAFTAPLPAGWPWPHDEPAGQAPPWSWEENQAASVGEPNT